MEILKLFWGNISIAIRIGDNLTDVYLKGCILTSEKQALSWCLHLLAVEDAVCGMRMMCWMPYAIIHLPALVTFLAQQDDFDRKQHAILCVGVSCIRLMYNQCKGCSRRQTSPFIVFSMSATQECVQPSISVPWRGMKKKIQRKFGFCDDQTNCIRVTAADVPGQLIFVRGSL
jgi:hypothetical protein